MKKTALFVFLLLLSGCGKYYLNKPPVSRFDVRDIAADVPLTANIKVVSEKKEAALNRAAKACLQNSPHFKAAARPDYSLEVFISNKSYGNSIVSNLLFVGTLGIIPAYWHETDTYQVFLHNNRGGNVEKYTYTADSTVILHISGFVPRLGNDDYDDNLRRHKKMFDIILNDAAVRIRRDGF